MEMSEKIKALRQQNNMTLEEVGKIVGVGKSTVRKWENGIIANMRRDKIAKLATALNTTPAYLMGWEENLEQANTDILVDLAVDLEAMEHVEKLLKLNAEAKKAVYNMIDVLSEKGKY